MVMGEDIRSRGHDFESRHWMNIGPLFVIKSKKPKINATMPGDDTERERNVGKEKTSPARQCFLHLGSCQANHGGVSARGGRSLARPRAGLSTIDRCQSPFKDRLRRYKKRAAAIRQKRGIISAPVLV